MGLHGRVQRKVPFINKKVIRRQYAWAKAHRKWPLEKWILVWYSDESKYLIFGSDGRLYCRRRPGEEFLPRNVTMTVKHGGGKVMVWGCISWHGVGELYHVQGNLEKFQFRSILKGPLLHSFDSQHVDPSYILFQMDNDPKHTSRVARQFLMENNMELLDWPPYSPDMNIIEHIWDVLEKRLHRRNPLPTSADTLFAALEEEWYSIPRITIQNLYKSIPARVEALCKARGMHTKY
jgi:hypothetical protein